MTEKVDNIVFSNMQDVIDFLRSVPETPHVSLSSYERAINWLEENAIDGENESTTSWV